MTITIVLPFRGNTNNRTLKSVLECSVEYNSIWDVETDNLGHLKWHFVFGASCEEPNGTLGISQEPLEISLFCLMQLISDLRANKKWAIHFLVRCHFACQNEAWIFWTLYRTSYLCTGSCDIKLINILGFLALNYILFDILCNSLALLEAEIWFMWGTKRYIGYISGTAWDIFILFDATDFWAQGQQKMGESFFCQMSSCLSKRGLNFLNIVPYIRSPHWFMLH